MTNSLEHYGIKGMKWGVRRTPEQLGYDSKTGKYVPHTIKKGTAAYRVSVKPGDAKGATYVTILPPDRDFYRGAWKNQISKQQGGGGKAFETEYRIDKNLRIANRKDISDVMEDLKSDKKVMTNMVKDFIPSDVNWDRERQSKKLQEHGEAYINDYMKKFGTKSMDEQYAVMTRSLTVSTPVFREAFIKKLKDKGFNGYIDEAGVGGLISPREGVEPLVIFDAEKVLTKRKESIIDERTSQEATKRYNDWKSTANLPVYEKEKW